MRIPFIVFCVANIIGGKVDALETDKFDGCVGWPIVLDRTELRPFLSRYYSFWDVVHTLLRLEHVYTFVTGKQTALVTACCVSLVVARHLHGTCS